MRSRSKRVSFNKSFVELGVRGFLALIFSMLGYVGISHSLAAAIKDRDPAKGHYLASNDGRISAALAQKEFAERPASHNRLAVTQLARLALLQDATADQAVATLGLDAQLRGDVTNARQLFSYSQKLTRRNPQTQFWAIEDAVSRGDIPGALNHYDIALRTSKTARELLFPVLADAIGQSDVRAGLLRTVSRRPPWLPDFLNFAATRGSDLLGVAQLMTSIHSSGTLVAPDAIASTVNGLIAANSVKAAWQLYASVNSGIDRDALRHPDFSANPAIPSLFDWTVTVDDNLSSSIQRGNQGAVFEFSAPPGVGGMVLRQWNMLSPGTYMLRGHATGVDQPEKSSPYWLLSCKDGKELGRVSLNQLDKSKGTFGGRIDVLEECPVQILALYAQPVESIDGIVAQVDRVTLKRVK